MRTSRFTTKAPAFSAALAIVVSAQLTLATSPAFAQAPTSPDAPPASSAAPAPSPAAPSTTSTPAKPSAPASAAASTDGTVMVHINSPTPVMLQKRSGSTGAWETVCTSPCDQRAPVGDEYQVTSERAVASKPFRLDSSRGNVVLDVTPGNPAKETAGLYVTIGGGVLVIAGVVVMIAGSKPSSTFPADGTTSDRNTNMLFVGGALIFSGIVAVIYGGAMMYNNKTSAVEGDVSKAGPAQGAKDVFVKTASVPAPTTPTFIMPVFTGTF